MSVYQPGPSYRPAALHADSVQGLLAALENGRGGHHNTGDNRPFLGHSIRPDLPDVQSEPKVSIPDVLNVVEAAGVYILDDKRFYERNVLGLHRCNPPAGCVSLREIVSARNSAPANHNICDRDGVIAELHSSIVSPRQNLPEISQEFPCGSGGQYEPCDDPALSFYGNQCTYSDIAVDRLNYSASRESIRRDNRLRYWTRLVSFSHGGLPS